MKRAVVMACAILMLATLSGCSRGPVQPGKPAFNASSEKLAEIAAGDEAGDIAFSSDGRSVAFATLRGGKGVVYLNKQAGASFDSVKMPLFSSDGRHHAFIAGKESKELVVLNGRAGALYDSIGKLHLARDGRPVYEAQRKDKWVIVSGVLESAPFDTSMTDPVTSHDSRRLAYIEQNSTSMKSRLRVCTIDLKECAQGEEYDLHSMIRSDPSRSTLLYMVARDGKKSLVTVDFSKPGLVEKLTAWYDDINIYAISDNNSHVAFLAQRGDKSFLVKDGVEQPSPFHSNVFDMIIAESGQTLYTSLEELEVKPFVDGVQIGKKGYDGIYSPIISRDGSRYAFVAESASKNAVVVNGVQGPLFDKVVTPGFSPDGSRIVYRARNNGERFVVVADSQGKVIRQHPSYDAIWDVVFSPDGASVGYGVRIGNQLWWKVEKL